ncbi:MAG TPA: ABC transporter substrate-binding protein [Longimicrobiales bacterium]
MPHRLRAAAFLSAVLLASCDAGERPKIAIATNREFAEAAALAVADAQAEWGELPGDTVVAHETLTRAAVAIENATELVAQGLAAVIGHSNSAASLAAAPIYNEAEVVQLSPQSSAAAYSQAGPYSFRLVPPDDQQGGFLAQSLRAMPGVKRIVVLYVNDDYGRGLRSSLLEALGSGGPQVVAEAPHLEASTMRPEDLDLARRVVAEADPDAVVWLGRPLILEQHLPVLLPVLGERPIIGSDAIALADRYGDYSIWNTVWYVDFVDMGATPALIDFNRRFAERFGRHASGPDALTYDATRLLLTALREGATDGPAIRRWLESLGRTRPAYEGLTGPVRFDADGDVERSYVLRRFTPSSAPPRPLPQPVEEDQ